MPINSFNLIGQYFKRVGLHLKQHDHNTEQKIFNAVDKYHNFAIVEIGICGGGQGLNQPSA